MKKTVFLLLSALIVLSFLTSCGKTYNTITDENDRGAVFYVSKDGSDDGDGSEGKPFATITAARDAVRKLKSEKGLPDGGVAVKIAEGKYTVTESITLTSEDAGEPGKPIVYEGIGNVEISGGVVLDKDDFEPASEEIKARISDSAAKDKLLQIDLKKAGCYNIDASEFSANVLAHELFVGYERQTVSRWPNGEYCFTDGWCLPTDGTLNFPITAEQAGAWYQSDNIMFYGFPEYEWRAYLTSVSGVDTENNTLVFKNYPYEVFGKNEGYYLFHILEETDEPGEYYIDYKTDMMYYYPSENFETSEIAMSQITGGIFSGESCDCVTFKNLVFEYSTENGICLESSDGVTVENCVFRNIGKQAVLLNGMSDTVKDCELYNLGTGGILVNGGDYSLIPSNNLVTNNYIHDWAQVYTVYNAAITIYGYGATVSHNKMHTAPHEAIAFNCGTTLIEYNEIYDVCRETCDAGAIYSGRRWDWGDNIIRYNYIHDMGDVLYEHHGSRPCAVYLDDSISLQNVYGNIFENIDGQGIRFGGKYVNVTENLFINVSEVGIYSHNGMVFSNGNDHISYKDGEVWPHLIEADYTNGIWRYYFPENLVISEIITMGANKYKNMDDPGTRSYVKMEGNVAIGCEIYTHYVPDADYGNIIEIFGTMFDNSAYADAEQAGLKADYTFDEAKGVARNQLVYPKIDFAKIGLQ